MPTMIDLICPICKNDFQRTLSVYNLGIKRKSKIMVCSNSCLSISNSKSKMVNCKNCNKPFQKMQKEINKSKSGNHFCSRSCSAIYNNAHKTTGTRVSKLEVWLQPQLTELYPNLDILYNDKETIKSELDIYIPSLQLAFELNGIFHYEPIFGENKLESIQNNDHKKFHLCVENKIDMCTIDTSSQKRFTEKSSVKYLDIITKVINERSVP